MLTDTGNMLRDRRFLGKAVTIAFPVAMQGMLNTIVNLVDTMMIGTLGETSIAAVGLANKVFFVFSLLVFGIVSGSGVLAAQYWGNHDVKNIRKVLGLALMISTAGSLCFLIPAQICPEGGYEDFYNQPKLHYGRSGLSGGSVSFLSLHGHFQYLCGYASGSGKSKGSCNHQLHDHWNQHFV